MKLKALATGLVCLTLSLMVFNTAAATGAAALVGSWKMYKDDDLPDGPIVDETISFWPSGKFSISGKPPHQGLYRVQGDELQFIARAGYKGIPVSRGFKLEGKTLWLKNMKTGWVYYRQVSEQPQGKEPSL